MTQPPFARFLDRRSPPVLLTLVLIAGMGAMSLNIFLPSLPAMALHFGADYAVMQLSVSLYLVATAVLQLVIGPLSDRYGRRRVMLAALTVFILATLGAMLAQNVTQFLAFRLIQAVIASGLALSRAVVRDMVDDAGAASRIGYVTMGMALVPMVSPMLGGALESAFGWQSSFAVLALFGSAVLALVWADMGETARGAGRTLRAQIAEYPELLRSQRFWGYALTAAFSSGAFFAFLGGAPFLGSEVFDLDPATLGLYFGAPALGYTLGNFLSGRYSVQVGLNRMILWGTGITAAGMAVSLGLSLGGITHPAVFFGFVTFVGLGNGMSLPNAMAGQLSIRPSLAGSASGLGGALMIGGGAALSALAGLVLSPDRGAWPLQTLMLATSLAAIGAILWVLRREAVLRG